MHSRDCGRWVQKLNETVIKARAKRKKRAKTNQLQAISGSRFAYLPPTSAFIRACACVCVVHMLCRGYPTLTQNFKPIFSYMFQHADSSQIDCRSKRKFFCAPRRARAWAKSVLASPAQGHSIIFFLEVAHINSRQQAGFLVVTKI